MSNLVEYNTEQLALLKRTMAEGATNDEFALFVGQCQRTGLDPMTRQIYFIKDKKGKVTVCASIDGLRLVAERSGNYEGQTKPEWCGDDGVWKDIWLSEKLPRAARVGVWKTKFKEPTYGVALFDEYAGKFPDGNLTYMWNKMPALMIAKVAEALALRKAFPNDLSGIYSSEEAEQIKDVKAEEPPKTIQPPQEKPPVAPPPKDVVISQDMVTALLARLKARGKDTPAFYDWLAKEYDTRNVMALLTSQYNRLMDMLEDPQDAG